MKHVIPSAALIIIISSFVSSQKDLSFPTLGNRTTMVGKAWQLDETMIFSNLTLYTCKGEEVFFPELQYHMDFHGVDNGKMTLVQGKSSFYGIGSSTITGEEYIFSSEAWSNTKTPIVNGAFTLTSTFKGGMTGELGTLDFSSLRSHTTITPDGKLMAIDINPSRICE